MKSKRKSNFDKNLISKEHLDSIKGGYKITAVRDWCTYTGDHEDGDDTSFYSDGTTC